jgi:hypothetical protein
MNARLRNPMVVFETLLVGIPCGVWWAVRLLVLAYVSVNAVPSASVGTAACWCLILGSRYFLLPYRIAPWAFDECDLGIIPNSLLGWVVVVATYSVLSLGLALLWAVGGTYKYGTVTNEPSCSLFNPRKKKTYDHSLKFRR